MSDEKTKWSRKGSRVVDADGQTMALVPCDDTRERSDGVIVEVMSRDAVLRAEQIALLPELLSSLQDLIDAVSLFQTGRMPRDLVDEQAPKFHRACALIEKSRGAP